MAQIISSEVISDRPQADGRRYVRVRFVAEDHDGAQRSVYVGPRLVPSDFNVDVWRAGHVDTVLERLAQDEDISVRDLNAVENPLTVALNPKWSTTKRIAKTLLYWMIEEKDPSIVVYLEPLILHIQQNYTGAQIANLLDISLANVSRLNRRVNAVLSPPASTESMKDLLAAFDAEEGSF